ncbi:MAG: YVTN family beta-propeller repeat protein [Halieaceae bacterium]|nr:YVTN family beta-propeller repeat protein [Halieaceae bacterium]
MPDSRRQRLPGPDPRRTHHSLAPGRCFRRIALAALAAATLAPLASLAEIAYVSNEKDNTLTLIDIDTLEVVDTIEVGMRPRGITFNRDFSHLYICASDSDAVQVFDVRSRRVIANLPSGEDPEQFALHPDDRRLYIANEDNAVVTVVDTQERTVIGQVDVGVEPEGMAVSPDGAWAVNTSETTNMLHWIDTQTNELVDNTLVGQRPRHVEFTRSGDLLWASSEIGGTVTVIRVEDREVLRTLDFRIPGVHRDRIQPVGIRLTSDGRFAFVALGPANHVAVVDAQSYEVLDYLLVGRRVWHMAFARNEELLLTTNGVSGDVTVIDVGDLKPIKTIRVGRYPWGVAVAP